MKLRVIVAHGGFGDVPFPTFAKGTPVSGLTPDDEYQTHAEAIWGEECVEHWVSCTIEGRDTFISNTFITNGALNRDYNPTEIIVKSGQILTLIELAFEWLYVQDESGNAGWLPACKAVSA
jgi:hypothetical protein